MQQLHQNFFQNECQNIEVLVYTTVSIFSYFKTPHPRLKMSITYSV